jgi:heme/copper-type cytochrome/quinol oxidase subunit 4
MMTIGFGTIVYALCALTSIACAVLLLRGYRRSRVRLLLWSGLCFVGLALNNVVLFIDLRVLPETDLSLVRTLPAIAGVMILIYGLVWETR